MTWLLIAGLALVALAPTAWALLRPPRARGRAEADRALYAAQRVEIDREFSESRMDEAAHRAALLELQRRLLAAPQEGVVAPGPGAARPLAAVVMLVPLLALVLYLAGGYPEMPSAPYAERREQLEREDMLVATLRARITQLPASSAEARQGLILLGNAESQRGNFDAAADAWTRALAIRFDAGIAADVAEIALERGQIATAARLVQEALKERPREPRLRFLDGLAAARGGRLEIARATWQALLAEAPANAPWRRAVEGQLEALP